MASIPPSHLFNSFLIHSSYHSVDETMELLTSHAPIYNWFNLEIGGSSCCRQDDDDDDELLWYKIRVFVVSNEEEGVSRYLSSYLSTHHLLCISIVIPIQSTVQKLYKCL